MGLFELCVFLGRILPDRVYLKIMYYHKFKRRLNLKNPKSFNEKLQWLKLYDRKPEYTIMVDKYEAKKYVASRIGEEYIIPTLGVWDKFDDIDFDALPDQFVLKCTHDSGGLVICRDKSTFDRESARKKINRCLRKNYYWVGREWPYKAVPRRIIAEKYMEDESGIELKDYKIFNFDGEPRLIQVDYNRFVNHMRNLYSTDWKYIEAEIEYPTNKSHAIAQPESLQKLLELGRTLSEGIPFLRTDFYLIDNSIYFGELTFYHGSGFEHFRPDTIGDELGRWIILSEKRGGIRR